MRTLSLFWNVGPWETALILLLALLLFGRRLPEVGKALGKGIVEFKRGVKGIEDEIESEANRPPERPRPPLTAAGEDARASFDPRAGDEAEHARSEPAAPAPDRHAAD